MLDLLVRKVNINNKLLYATNVSKIDFDRFVDFDWLVVGKLARRFYFKCQDTGVGLEKDTISTGFPLTVTVIDTCEIGLDNVEDLHRRQHEGIHSFLWGHCLCFHLGGSFLCH